MSAPRSAAELMALGQSAHRAGAAIRAFHDGLAAALAAGAFNTPTDRTKDGPTVNRTSTRRQHDDLTQPLHPGRRWVAEPNPAIGRWHITEVTPELLAAQAELARRGLLAATEGGAS